MSSSEAAAHQFSDTLVWTASLAELLALQCTQDSMRLVHMKVSHANAVISNLSCTALSNNAAAACGSIQ
jgi:hypothetical protein